MTNERWVTVGEVSKAGGFVSRTARKHLSELAKVGVADRQKLHPGFRFKLREPASAGARALVERLEQAAEVYGAPRPPHH